MELSERLRGVCIWVLVAFLALCVFMGYWAVVRCDELRANPYNSSARERMRHTCPGRIFARDEEILGRRREGQGWVRTYPEGKVYCHLTGYGPSSALQKSLLTELCGAGTPERQWKELLGERRVGNDVYLSIVPKAQRLATDLLHRRAGAVVGLDPRSGALLVMASAPPYEPEGLLQDKDRWLEFRTHPEPRPELNRALQGLYPPGSVFKLITAAGALDSGALTPDTTYVCHGKDEIGGIEVSCWQEGGHGKLDLAQALERSCNVYFAHVAAEMGAQALSEYARGTGLFEFLAMPLPAKSSAIPVFRREDQAAAMATAYGQGKLQVTPLSLALLAGAVGSGGEYRPPMLIEKVIDADGRVVRVSRPGRAQRAMSAEAARLLAGMMRGAVEHPGGTARLAASSLVRVAGKTGSAQNPHGAAHAWFVGFAPVEAPRAAIAVVVEEGGSGGQVAAPIAREVLETLLR